MKIYDMEKVIEENLIYTKPNNFDSQQLFMPVGYKPLILNIKKDILVNKIYDFEDIQQYQFYIFDYFHENEYRTVIYNDTNDSLIVIDRLGSIVYFIGEEIFSVREVEDIVYDLSKRLYSKDCYKFEQYLDVGINNKKKRNNKPKQEPREKLNKKQKKHYQYRAVPHFRMLTVHPYKPSKDALEYADSLRLTIPEGYTIIHSKFYLKEN